MMDKGLLLGETALEHVLPALPALLLFPGSRRRQAKVSVTLLNWLCDMFCLSYLTCEKRSSVIGLTATNATFTSHGVLNCRKRKAKI